MLAMASYGGVEERTFNMALSAGDTETEVLDMGAIWTVSQHLNTHQPFMVRQFARHEVPMRYPRRRHSYQGTVIRAQLLVCCDAVLPKPDSYNRPVV